MGPVIGTTIYKFAHYENTFYILAGVLTLSLITAIILLPNRINKYNTKPSEKILEQRDMSRPSVSGIRPQGIAERYSVDMVGLAKTSERYSRRSHILQAQVTYKIFFTNLRAMTAIVSSMFAMIFMLFYEPVFTNYIAKQQKWISEDNVGKSLIKANLLILYRLLSSYWLLHLRFRLTLGRITLLQDAKTLHHLHGFRFLCHLPFLPWTLLYASLPCVITITY